ncbi:hybrid sensor histidine kinase/response regulator [Cyanobacterium sp. DS4]|uniref:hybrid sensor histidine kinase/response regulator n=1 Tax=Cyanobacterium sp. DS4 TaxID=2878255 RepID=UPI002E8140D6|nr:response regulator [Cyanobacterium sp. Dongsha4]WVK99540.1 response regulator [Cyanobacterium sp. Dongsha4]
MEKILVIEDEINIARNIKQILDLSDFYTITAEDGAEGVELAKEEIPDLILCDVMMPNLDGYQVLTELKKDSKTENIPFIFLTAKSDRPDFRKGMELGADDYLTKPFTPDELLTAVSTRLAKHQKMKKQAQEKMDELSSRIQKALPHELYTPLNGMMVSASLLNEYAESMSIEEIKDMAKTLLDSSQRLHQISEKFVLYTYLEFLTSNPEKLEQVRQKKYNCFTKTIIESIAKIEAQTFNRSSDLVLEIEEASINTSENDLHKIVKELVNNGFKFSLQGQQVKILSKVSDDNSYHLFVINEGKGMTAEQLDEIGSFRQFHQEFFSQEGCGLGLAIVKKLINIYQGSMRIESFIDNQTVVHIILPLGEK